MDSKAIVPYECDDDNKSNEQINEFKLQIISSSSDSDNNNQLKRKKRKILDEDEYSQKIGSIIERDFFPDLPKMRLELELQDAIKNNDFERISRLARKKIEQNNKGTNNNNMSNTPANFSTPASTLNDDEIRLQKIDPRDQDDDDETSDQSINIENLNLNKFLNKFTSEDNDTFERLQDKDIEKHLKRLEFLNSDSRMNNEMVERSIELPTIEQQQILMNSNQSTKELQSAGSRLITWKHSNKNSVMFDPDGVPFTENELELVKSKQIIRHENTRFNMNPFQTGIVSQQAAAAAVINNGGKIGVDGKEAGRQETPNINGFSFVPSTPCLKPENLIGGSSPLMTWGSIDATPINLKGDQTPLLHSGGGSHFKIPDISEKEQIGQQLANRILMKKKTTTENHMKSPFIKGTTNHERLNSMSPAAKLLAIKKLGVHQNIDNRLQASYSPLMTSISTPTPTPRRLITPSPSISNKSSSTMTPKTNSIMNNDNQHLKTNSKRSKASQFF
ncbi:DiGeorge syndrome critical region protein 14 [Dermatophagoides pteronyssinus]|uniref:DiGeorge syndrome critical region protein 14 n=1 Tax=Dermatophagoides pteronyssinus TaxID=6956 RepID=A0ABQ8JIB3_DERPT|nr:DiGeorge syndrome critical region protein 14 [Dermatophagoides pteronyssinus]